MPKSVTVNFEDGTSHVYDNVPDEITDAQVQERAKSEYADKPIQGVAPQPGIQGPGAAGAPAGAPQFGQYSTLPTSVGQMVAGAQVPFEMAAEHPAMAAGAAGLYKANQVANAYMGGKNAEAEAARQTAELRAQAAAGHQNIQQQKINARLAPVAGPVAPPAILGPNGLPMEPTMASRVAAPVAPVAAAAPVEQSLAGRVRDVAASKIAGLAQASPMLAQAGRVAGKILPGAGAALGGMEAYNRAQQGDYLGAGLAGVGGAASFVPGIGTAIGLGTTGINAARDYSKYLEAKRKYEEQQKAMKR
tara:strand:- start:429 stop:1340 length:912 start_codon:yes stop_codon:yes gene_type:complete